MCGQLLPWLKKIETGTQAKHRRVNAQEITRLRHVCAVVSIFLARVVVSITCVQQQSPSKMASNFFFLSFLFCRLRTVNFVSHSVISYVGLRIDDRFVRRKRRPIEKKPHFVVGDGGLVNVFRRKPAGIHYCLRRR